MSRPLPEPVRVALDQGDLIGAVRRLRQLRGLDLEQARALVVQGARREARRAVPARRPRLSPGEVPRGGGRAGLVVALLLVAGLLASHWLRNG